MRYPDLSLVGDLNDNILADTSVRIKVSSTSSVNENLTNYSLLPVVINKPPIIVESIYKKSTPKIKSYKVVSSADRVLYQNIDGVVQVHLGANMQLSLVANQSPTLNVENGVLKVIPPNSGLQYVWRKDGIEIGTLIDNINNTSIIIKENSIQFKNIQTADLGEYSCDVSNDIGFVSSETITLEVVNAFTNSKFFTNLIQNPAGELDLSSWNANNNQFAVRQFNTVSEQDLLKPTITDAFGYSANSINPKPAQIIQKYFTTSRYKFDRKGGSFLVRAYQDIDVTDIKWMLEGGVYGIDGVQATFNCYIGNAINQFIPNTFTVQQRDRVNPNNFNLAEPRISLDNYLKAGPGRFPKETVKVYLAEYEYENKLLSALLKSDGTTITTDNILAQDGWTRRYNKYAGKKYTSNSVGDDVDATLFVADEILPDKSKRYTYGQFIELNTITINKLNPKTTKLRITIDFELSDQRVFEQWQDAIEVSDEIFEFSSTEEPYYPNTLNQMNLGYDNFISTILKKTPGNENKNFSEIMSKAQDPRGLVTGLDLRLIPLFNSDVSKSDHILKYYLPASYD